MEQKLIKELKTKNTEYGYNLTNGGDGTLGHFEPKGLEDSSCINLIGQRFGRLIVINIADIADKSDIADKKGRSGAVWKCLCDCGETKYCFSNQLISGSTKSCGCLRKETNRENAKNNITHGDSYTRLYTIWVRIIQFTTNINTPNYEHYGGRGIKIYKPWLDDYTIFKDWAFKNGYEDVSFLRRIDIDKNFEPDNCIFIIKDSFHKSNTQHRNPITITYDNKTLKISEWSKETGINKDVIRERLKNNWDIEKALTTPVRGREVIN